MQVPERARPLPPPREGLSFPGPGQHGAGASWVGRAVTPGPGVLAGAGAWLPAFPAAAGRGCDWGPPVCLTQQPQGGETRFLDKTPGLGTRPSQIPLVTVCAVCGVQLSSLGWGADRWVGGDSGPLLQTPCVLPLGASQLPALLRRGPPARCLLQGALLLVPSPATGWLPEGLRAGRCLLWTVALGSGYAGGLGGSAYQDFGPHGPQPRPGRGTWERVGAGIQGPGLSSWVDVGPPPGSSRSGSSCSAWATHGGWEQGKCLCPEDGSKSVAGPGLRVPT